MRTSLLAMIFVAACGFSSSSPASCPIGETYCDGECVDVGSDPANCGRCGDACTTGAMLCQGGGCVAACSGNTVACAGGCVDTASDPANCGSCGHACPTGSELCQAGECITTASCPSAPVAPGGACPSECTGGCVDNQCTIDCTGEAQCDGAQIVCPPDFDCVVVCNGIDACDSGTIACPPGYGCTVICGGGHDACGDQRITCGAGPCSVECGADNCSGTMVTCGDGPCMASCGTPAPSVSCGSACACSGC